MMRTLFLLSLAACAPGYGYGSTPPAYMSQPGQGTQSPDQMEQPDTRSAGQVVVDTLAAQGYTCSVEDSRWQCFASGASWALYVSYYPQDDGSTKIGLDSYTERAFARPCRKLSDAMEDLAEPNDSFTATCDDSTHQIRMTSTFMYGADVLAWAQNHETRRTNAWRQLDSIHAVARR